MKFGLMVVAAALAMLAPGAGAKDKGATKDAAAEAALAKAFSEINASNPARSLEILTPVIAKYQRAYAGEKRKIFCSLTPEQEGYYVSTAEGGPDSVLIVPDTWCTAQFLFAYALVDLKRLDDAQAAFERLLAYAPKHSRYLNELGYVLLQKREWQRSIDTYVRAEAAANLMPLRQNEERCAAFRGIGYDLVELGKLDEAEAAYRKCLAITPNEPKSLGEIEYIKQQRRKAT